MTKQDTKNTVTTTRMVPAQRGDIYKVLSKGYVTEWTDRLQDAQSAYKEGSVPKTMFKIMRSTGAVSKLREELI